MTELKKIKSLPIVEGLTALATSVALLGGVKPAQAEEFRIMNEFNRNPAITRECAKEDVFNLNYGFTSKRERSPNCKITTHYIINNLGSHAGTLRLYNSTLTLMPFDKNLRIRITHANKYRISDQKLMGEFKFEGDSEIILGGKNLDDQIPLTLKNAKDDAEYISFSIQILGKDDKNQGQRNNRRRTHHN